VTSNPDLRSRYSTSNN